MWFIQRARLRQNNVTERVHRLRHQKRDALAEDGGGGSGVTKW